MSPIPSWSPRTGVGKNRHGMAARSIELPRKPLPEGRVYCHACDGAASLTPNKHLREHRTPQGDPCPNRTSGLEPRVHLNEIPEGFVHQPAPHTVARTKRPEGEPSRLDVGTGCRECGKWLPGERSLCGACYVKNGGR
jgi:hypothetical protein